MLCVSFATSSIVVGCLSTSQSSFQTQTPTEGSNIEGGALNITIEGTVLEVKTDEIRILTPENQEIRLYIDNQSTIWDGIDWVAKGPIEIGDDAIATGTWKENNSGFIVKNLYTNIVNLRGDVEEVDKGELEFTIDDPRQGNSRVLVKDLTKIYHVQSNRQGTYQDTQILPNTGEYVEVIGRKLNDGTILAVNITIP